MFKLLGAPLACYAGLCIARGSVFAKRGAWGRGNEPMWSPSASGPPSSSTLRLQLP
jgi:hypothetical protein